MIDAIDHEYVSDSISKVMVGNNCHPTFEFVSLSLPTVERYLRNLPNCKLILNLKYIAAPIMYVLNYSFATSAFPDQ